MIIRLIKSMYSSLQLLLSDKGVRYLFGIDMCSSIINNNRLYRLLYNVSYLSVADRGELDSP